MFESMESITDKILNKISDLKSKQKEVAELCAVAIQTDMDRTNWRAINNAILARWSKSARERVLTMAWKIVEDNKLSRMIEEQHRYQMRNEELT